MTNDCILNGASNKKPKSQTNSAIAILEAFPREEAMDELNSEYQIGDVVKIIDPQEHHSEWAAFEVAECRYNNNLYSNTESYLNQSEWYYRLINLDKRLHRSN